MARIERSQIKLAEYNPRQASKEAKRRLREKLKKTGLIGPALIWNRRTGNLVSGHLRIAQLDILEQGTDYHLDMTVVDWSEEQERQENVFLNNPFTQGEFDLDRLGELLAADLAHLEGFGMDPVEIQHLFPSDERFGELFQDVAPEASTMPNARAALDEIEADKDAAKAEKKNRREPGEMQAERKEYGEILDAANASDFYVVIVCRDGQQCADVLQALGAKGEERYVSAELVLNALGESAELYGEAETDHELTGDAP